MISNRTIIKLDRQIRVAKRCATDPLLTKDETFRASHQREYLENKKEFFLHMRDLLKEVTKDDERITTSNTYHH